MANRFNIHIRDVLSFLLMLGLVFFMVPRSWAQENAPEFEVDAISVRADSSTTFTRLDVYTKLPYTSLRFINTPSGFTARYGVTLEVHEYGEERRTRNLIQNRFWEQTVVVDEFARTQMSQLFDRTIQSIELLPGRYLLQFQVEDQATNETYVRELPVNVRDVNKPVAIADLILIDSYDQEANTITPSVSNRLGSDQVELRLFYEIYTDQPQRVNISREVVRVHKGVSSVRALLGWGRSDEVQNAEVSYQQIEPQRLHSGRNQYVVEIPMDNFKVGEYIVRVNVEDEDGQLIDSAEKAMTSEWTGLAEHIRDLNEAIAQLQYIAKTRDLTYIREGRTEAERLNRFKEFWVKRDPTPATAHNERMEEYYYRISFANRQYGNFGAGWKTDRGLVMVKFGEPDYIERHPFSFNADPYEVWYYYSINRRFIFIDKTGFGDYELLVPYWDERTRIR